MAQVYISLGSNIEPEKHLRAAVRSLREQFGELELSSVYRSKAVGFEGKDFLNLVAGFDTSLSAHEVNRKLHEIEDQHGRTREGPRFSDRVIDLDLLMYDDLTIDDDDLHLPREEITQNAFVLLPLSEIAPELQHPELRQTVADLWEVYDKEKQPLTPIPFEW
jgi:2-amino-4-hydroxy-6-hydroxymethyldihydropteridine diphosphokinase